MNLIDLMKFKMKYKWLIMSHRYFLYKNLIGFIPDNNNLSTNDLIQNSSLNTIMEIIKNE